jgi:hypothetical protein
MVQVRVDSRSSAVVYGKVGEEMKLLCVGDKDEIGSN